MERTAAPTRYVLGALAASAVILILAYVYVISFSVGWRSVAVVNGAVLFFCLCGVFIRHLRAFLLFTAIFSISLGYGYFLIHQPVLEMESQPVSIGIRIELMDVALALLYAQWALRSAGNRMQPLRLTLGHPLGTILLIWIIYGVVSASVLAGHFKYSAFSAIELFKGFMLFFYLVNNISEADDLKIIVYALFASTVAHALYIGFQYATGLNFPLQGEFTHFVDREGLRPAGFFGTWDGAAVLMAMVFPVGLAYLFVIEKSWKRRLTVLGLTIVFVGILLTKTRATWVAILISTIMVIWLTRIRARVSKKTMARIIAACVVLIVPAIPFVVSRLLTGTYGEDRLPLIYTAIAMIKENWVAGVGLGNYVFYMQDYLAPAFREEWTFTVHNEYLLWLAETGVLGFSLYYLLLGLVIAKLWRMTKSSDTWVFLVAAGLCSGLIGSLPNRMLTFYHFTPTYLQYCVVLALAIILERLEMNRSEET
jgi:O-antigen ligase